MSNDNEAISDACNFPLGFGTPVKLFQLNTKFDRLNEMQLKLLLMNSRVMVRVKVHHCWFSRLKELDRFAGFYCKQLK